MKKNTIRKLSLALAAALILAALMPTPATAEPETTTQTVTTTQAAPAATSRGIAAVKPLTDLVSAGVLPGPMPEISCRSAYLIELNTGEVLYAKNPDESRYPASITKVMTALVVLEHCDLTEQVTFSRASVTDLEDGGYDSRFKEGEVLTVEQCLYGMLLDSVNSCAYALAEHVAGSVTDFAALMNQKATEIGCTNSNFENPHGLNNDKHRTTAHDMALILWNALQNPDFAKIDGTLTYEIPPTDKQPKGYKFTMHHKMMDPTGQYYYAAVKAGKTGYTSLAFHTLVTYAEKDGVQLVCITMKEQTGGSHIYEDAKKLLDYGFDSFTLTDYSEKAENYLSALNAISPIPVKMDTDLLAYLPDSGQEVSLSFAPSAGSAALGSLNLTYRTAVIASKTIQIDRSLIEITEPSTEEPTDPAEETESTSGFVTFLKFIGLLILILIVGVGGYWSYVQIVKKRRRKERMARAKRKARLRKIRETKDYEIRETKDYEIDI